MEAQSAAHLKCLLICHLEQDALVRRHEGDRASAAQRSHSACSLSSKVLDQAAAVCTLRLASPPQKTLVHAQPQCA